MDRESRVLALFERYLEMPASTRDAWLAVETAQDPILSAKLAEMILADRNAAIETGGAIRDSQPVPAPDRIGAYRIEGLIGHGGMGSVYRGVRDGGDFTHEVAIKIIKPGLLSERLDERFRAERRVLASLRHPNIAQLYDGGETSAGAPCIVMELVEGAPLLAFADAHQLSTDKRAALFETVCGAVAFAHRSLIVHRDITPSNIMVTTDGVPKLIDFGIARAAEVAADAEYHRPSIASLSLTPGYAAPERMSAAPITTSADIYSLGKVLSALIAERDADLDAIVERATAASPETRYPTAEALGDDVALWRAQRPVSARNGGWRDRFVKLVRRNRAASLVVGMAAALMISAFVGTALAYLRAEEARRAEAARFADLRQLAGFVLFDLDGSLSRVIGTLEARRALAERAQRYLSGLADEAANDSKLADEAARGFLALAVVRGVPTLPNLGEPQAARADLARAEALGAPTTRTEALALRALIEGHVDGSPERGERTLAQAERLLAGTPRSVSWLSARARLRRSQIEIATLRQKPEALLAASDLLARETAALPPRLIASRAAAIDRAAADHGKGIAAWFVDDLTDSLAAFARAERHYAALERKVPNDPAVAYQRAYNAYLAAGVAASMEGRQSERDAFLGTARATVARLRTLEPTDNLTASLARSIRGSEAEALSAAGRHHEAMVLQRANVAEYAARAAAEPGETSANKLILATVSLANLARAGGDRVSACAAYAEIAKQANLLATKGALIDFIGNYRTSAADNGARCRRGEQVAAFEEM